MIIAQTTILTNISYTVQDFVKPSAEIPLQGGERRIFQDLFLIVTYLRAHLDVPGT